MSSFFSDLKKRRDLPVQPQSESSQDVQQSSSGSFFSNLKQKRDNPKPTVSIDAEDQPETWQQKVRSGAADVAGQAVAGYGSGLIGTYGNLANLTGLNPEEGYIRPGEKAQYELESNILERVNNPGYKPSVSEIYALSSDDDIAPRYSRLPSSREVGETFEDLGIPQESESFAGRAVRRGSEILGGSNALGMGGVVPAAAAGVAGEGTKSLGGGPLAQAAVEIATMLATGPKSATPFQSGNKAVQARVDALRKIGYSDQDILLAVNAEKAASKQVKTAKATSRSERVIDETLKKSEDLYEKTLENAFTGFKEGPEEIHRVASESYGKVARDARKIAVTDASRFSKTIDNVQKRLNNIANVNPEAKSFVDNLSKLADQAKNSKTADAFIEYYQQLNKMGNWADPKLKEKLIGHVKKGIKSSFRNSGPEGKQLLEDFERVNTGIQKAYQAEAVSDLVQKAHTAEGMDWSKMLKQFDKKSTWETLEKGLGKDQARNLYDISKVAKGMGDLSKNLGSKSGKGFVEKAGDVSTILGIFTSLMKHDSKYALLGSGIKGATSLGKSSYSRLQTRLLTDPKFQNISLKILKAVKEGHPKALNRASQQFKEYVKDEEDIDLDNL